jgi:hypothetical protein
MRTDLENTCLGSQYLENLSAIHQHCKFDLVSAQEHVFQLLSNEWLISPPKIFTSTVKCQSNKKKIFEVQTPSMYRHATV